MVSSSLLPGSLVTVSLPALGSARFNRLPLDAFADGLAEDLGIERTSIAPSGAGSYFVVTTVFPSRKVQKNGVRLSYDLFAAMGFPAMGKSVYISSIKSHPASMSKAGKPGNSQFPSCKELYLKLVPIDPQRMALRGVEASVTSEEKSPLPSKVGSSSPKTPSSDKSKLSSPVVSTLRPCGTKKLMPSASGDLAASFLATAAEDEKAKEMLKIYACGCLKGRHLLVGNFISLLLSGASCMFVVEALNNLDLTHKENHEDQMSKSLEQKYAILEVNHRTEVFIDFSWICRSVNTNSCVKFPSKEGTWDKAEKMPLLGGLDKEYADLKEIINVSLMQKGSPKRYKGVLLHGPPGTGKTSLALTCARDAGANIFFINGPEVVSEYYGESEHALTDIFDSARKATPAVVFIDELDALTPARKDGGEELSLRMLATLLTLMDGIHKTDGVLVIAATNRLDSIDHALRRPGRLDKEIELGVPSPNQRLKILKILLDEKSHSLDDKEIEGLAMSTHGFVGADLASLCNQAAMITLRRYIKLKRSVSHSDKHLIEDSCLVAGMSSNLSSIVKKADDCSSMELVDSASLSLMRLSLSSDSHSLSSDQTFADGGSSHNVPKGVHDIDKESLKITADDMENAKVKVRPSAMREVMIEFPKVSWEDIGGQAEVKKQLIEAVQWQRICPDAFGRVGVRPPRGLLMFGPPGCSKTLLARAVASEAKLNFLAVKGPELYSKWVGESEKAVKKLFTKAKANSPSVIFFDEIDGLAVTRGNDHDGTSVGDRVLNQLLLELDGLDRISDVIVIAATNRPDKIDPALLRPGRFDRHLDVKPPNESDREAIFQIHLRNMPCSFDVTAKDLATLTDGFTGADIKLVCWEAGIAALEESMDIPHVCLRHFQIGIGRVNPSDVQFYLPICEKFKRYVASTRESFPTS